MIRNHYQCPACAMEWYTDDESSRHADCPFCYHLDCQPLKSIDLSVSRKIIDSYPEGICPDCYMAIPEDVTEGEACLICGHTFYLSKHDDTMVSFGTSG